MSAARLRVIEGGAAVVVGEAARLQLVECRAILGGARDPFRVVWDERASVKDRRLLLAMAGLSLSESARCKGLAWCDLRPALRGDIRRGLARFREWSARLGEVEA